MPKPAPPLRVARPSHRSLPHRPTQALPGTAPSALPQLARAHSKAVATGPVSPPRGPYCSRTAIRPRRAVLAPARASLRPPLEARPSTCGSEGRGFEPRRSPSSIRIGKPKKRGLPQRARWGRGPPCTTARATIGTDVLLLICCRGIGLLTIRYIHPSTLHMALVLARGGLRSGFQRLL
jgi:hypothetical protein